MATAHQNHLEKLKYRQWVKAGLSLGYLTKGLAPFSQGLADQHHKDILKDICGNMKFNCKCLQPNCKKCQKNIRDLIKDDHVNSCPNWKNTDMLKLSSDPWSAAKCYIHTGGYKDKATANDTDCSGLLTIILNNKYFLNHISDPLNIFIKVREHRNMIFHSSNQELEEATANSYVDDMITVLQDPKELVTNPYAQQAVLNLQELKNKDFIITSENLEKLLKQVREDLMHELNELESTVSTKNEVVELERKISNIGGLLNQTRDDLMLELNNLKSAASTKEEVDELNRKIANIAGLLKETKDEVAKSAESTQQLVTQTKDEVAKSAESTKELLTHTNEIKRKMDTLISEQEEIKTRQRVEESPDEKQLKYEKTKSDLQSQMIERYRKTLLQVPVIPTNKKTYIRSFDEIYIRPTITREVKGEKGETEEKVVNSMSEIFTKDALPLKSIYVVGDAGTGKSSFCNYMVNCWCMAHSEGQIAENEFGGVKEMKKFDILFYVALRRYQNVVKIHEMLEKHYNSNILNELLDKESEKIIILLDGLDEWSSVTVTDNQFQTEGLPEQHFLKDYTIVTTSRPWKIHTLEISETEIQQMLKLKGFDDKSETIMIYRTIKHINSDRGDKEDIQMCKEKLSEKSLRSLKQVPIMLQQLICLWIDGKLYESSKCAVYTGMLELFFTWNEKKGTGKCASSPIKVHLPQYFAMKRKCKSNCHLIYYMSQLAYETLFKCPKDQSLTFDINVFDRLEILDEIRESCLKIGLLTEDRCPSLFVSEPPSSMFSFIHKSVQEFLAAVNIAINYKTKIDSSNNPENAETQRDCILFVQEVFKNCSTVKEILEQSNVIIMLCGLEPRLATHVSRYICDIVSEDPLVQRYRRTVDSDIMKYLSDYRWLVDIHNLIFESMKECNASTVESRPTFHIGDLYIDDDDSCDIICSCIDQQQITPDSVCSIDVDDINTENVKFLKYLQKFKHLEKIIIKYSLSSTESVEEANKSVAETIKINTSTLKSLSLRGIVRNNDKLDSLCKNIVHLLPSMNNLVAIEMTRIQMSHDDNSRFCEFLKGTSHLEQIHINIECECRIQHVVPVDLSKHQQLQYLDLGIYMCITDIDTVNLEVLRCRNIKSTNYIKIFDSIMKCEKLKELYLKLDIIDKSVSFHTSITDRLVSVLPLLHNLSKLYLWWLRLTDNIIQVPSEMKSLKVIDFHRVTMSLTTWKKFVDSLPSIPHTVNVRLFSCYITRDGEEFNDDRLSYIPGGVKGEKRNEAKQYVKDKKQLLNVDVDLFEFKFSTIK